MKTCIGFKRDFSFCLRDNCFLFFPSYLTIYIHTNILIVFVSMNRKEHKQGGGGVGGKGDWKVTDDGSY